MAAQRLVIPGLLLVEFSRSHSGTPKSVGLLWMSDQPDAETYIFTTRDTRKILISMLPGGVRTRSPNKRVASDPLLRPRVHRDGRLWNLSQHNTLL